MAESFDPYYTWLGIPPEEQPADHYRLLGVRRFEANEEVILNASDQRMGFIRSFQTGKRSKESQLLLNEISAAQVCLLNPAKKKAYDDDLRRKLGQTSIGKPADNPPSPQPTPIPARPLPQAVPLRPSNSSLQPLNSPQQTPRLSQSLQPANPLRPAPLQPVMQPWAPLPAPDPLALAELNPLAPAQLTTNPLRPVVAPQDNTLWTPRMLIIAGSATGALIVLLGLVVWAVTRPASTQQAGAPDKTLTIPAGVPAPQSPLLAVNPSAPVMPISASPSESPASNISPSPSTPSPVPSTPTPASSPGASPPPAPDPQPPPPAIPAISPAAPRLSDSVGNPLIATFSGAGSGPRQMAYSLNFGHLATWDATARRCDVFRLGANEAHAEHAGMGVVFSPDNVRYAVLHADRVEIYRFEPDGTPNRLFQAITGSVVHAACFSPDAKLLFLAVAGKPPLRTYELDRAAFTDVAITSLSDITWLGACGSWLVCWSPQKKAQAISLADPKSHHDFEGEMDYPPLVMLGGDSDSPYVSAWTRIGPSRISLHRSHISTGRRFAEGHIERVSDPAQILAVSQDGNLLAVVRSGALAIVRSWGNFELTRIEPAAGVTFSGAALTTSEGLLAFKGPADAVWIADLKRLTAQPRWRIEEQGAQFALLPHDDPALPRISPEAGEAAIAALRAAGVQLPTSVSEVTNLNTRGTKFAPEHAHVLAQFPQLNTLSLDQNSNPAKILRTMPELTGLASLELNQCQIGDDDLQFVKKRCPELQVLNIAGSEVKGPGLAHLRGLKLRQITLPNELPAANVIPHLATFTELGLINGWPVGMTDEHLKGIGGMKDLESLDLSQAKITAAGLNHLKSLVRLRFLQLPRNITREALPALAGLNLNSVLFPPGTLSADLAPFAGNPSLKMVHLPDTVSDEGLRILVTFPALEMVDLSSCSNLTEAGFRELAKSRTIRTLVLPQRMTDEGMKQLAGLASLQRIYLSNTEVSDQGIAALKDHASLEELFLSRSVTNACIPALAAMPALRNLELRTDKITAEGLGGLNASRSLRALNLNRLNVDESGIKALGKLTQLEQLSIYNPGLSPAQVETLKAALPKCNINTN